MDIPSFEELIVTVRDTRLSVEERSAAIGGLIMLNDRRALEPLVEVFAGKQDNPYIRAHVARSIGRIGLGHLEDMQVVYMLLAALRDPTENEEVRAGTAMALGELHAARAVEPLIEALGDASSLVRELCAAALRLLRDKRALNPLSALLHDDSSDVRAMAASALAQVGDRSDEQAARAAGLLIGLLSDESARVRRSAVEALGKLGGTEAMRPIARVLLDKHREAQGFEEKEVRWEAAKALGALAELTNTALLDAIRAESANSSVSSADAKQPASSEPARAEAREALLTVFNDKTEHPHLRSLAVRSLGSFGAGDLLVRVLLDQDEQPGVRGSAARALSDTGHVQAVEVLLSVLKDSAEPTTVRTASGMRVGFMQSKPKEAVGPLISVLQDTHEDDLVRQMAATVLGALGERSAIDPLLEALKQIDGERTRGEPVQSQGPRSTLFHTVIGAVGKLGDARAVEPLIALVRRESAGVDPYTRSIVFALRALGDLGDRRAVAPILALLDGHDEEDHVLMSAMMSLGELGDKRAVTPMIRMLGNGRSSIRVTAARVLGRLGDAGAVEPLIEALEDASVQVRIAAADALGKLGDPRALPALRRLQFHDTGETVEGDTVKEAASEAEEQIRLHLP